MSWWPTIVVTLDGEDVTGRSIESITITRGRDGVDQQPRPGYAQVTLLDRDASLDRTSLDAPLTVTVDGVALVTDADVSDASVKVITLASNGDRVARHRVMAVGKLARLHRREADGSYVQQKDGDRVAAILGQLALSWASATTYAGTDGAWAEVPAGETWETIDPTPLDVDQPGEYTLSAVSTPADPWRSLQQAANDGGGVVAELRGGGIRYTDALGRTARAAADGFYELPASAVPAAGMELAASVADLANRVRLKYAGDAEVVAEDTALIDRDGIRELRVDTNLANETDAQARADRLLRLRKLEAASIENVSLNLNGLRVTAAERQALLELEVGTSIRLLALPPALGGTFTGVVEAMTWTIDLPTVRLDLQVSDWAFSEYAIRWEAVDPADTWASIDPTITWTNAQELVA